MAALTINGGTFDMTDGQPGTLDVTGSGGLTVKSASLTFDLCANGSDEIVVSKQATVTGTSVISVDVGADVQSLQVGQYTLIQASGGLGTSHLALSKTSTAVTVGGVAYDLSLAQSSGTQEILSVSLAPSTAVSSALSLGTSLARWTES